jgi:hypothetical protein
MKQKQLTKNEATTLLLSAGLTLILYILLGITLQNIPQTQNYTGFTILITIPIFLILTKILMNDKKQTNGKISTNCVDLTKKEKDNVP